ncbi:lytic transglycosylase domain-containing protein [uncultured Ruthenibacterium sp.]|uniref:lytic transglycosylase domain-containing protein n=1 Tax=uncultured Ruthenibacterium sp. TaxID=1905347 RepID=UPI00349EEA75
MKKGRTFKSVFGLLLAAALVIAVVPFAAHKARISLYPKKYSSYVSQYAQEYGIDENYVYAIIRTESGFDSKAESDAGARGLMQITQETFEWIKTKIAPSEELGFDSLYDPQRNIQFGTYFLAVCLERYDGDLATAAAAYHSGIGKVNELLTQSEYSSDGRTLHTFPYSQMSNYVHKVQKNYQEYCALYS